MAHQQNIFKPKPPKQGTGDGQYSLGDWLPKMRSYLVVANLWDITEADIGMGAMTNAQLRSNGLAHLCLVDNLSVMLGEMVSHHERAHDVWQNLQQVSLLLYVYISLELEWIIDSNTRSPCCCHNVRCPHYHMEMIIFGES